VGVDRFLRTGFLDKPPKVLLSALASLRAKHDREGHKIQLAVERMVEDYPDMRHKFQYQGKAEDELFHSNYEHVGGETCLRCDRKNLVDTYKCYVGDSLYQRYTDVRRSELLIMKQILISNPRILT
jgi:hypothetical protein